MTRTVTITVEEYDKLREESRAFRNKEMQYKHEIRCRIFTTDDGNVSTSYTVYFDADGLPKDIKSKVDELENTIKGHAQFIIQENDKLKELYKDRLQKYWDVTDQLYRIPKWIVKLFN